MSSSMLKAELEKEFSKLGQEGSKIRKPQKPHHKRLKKSFKARNWNGPVGSNSSKLSRNLEKLKESSSTIDSKIVESVLEEDSRQKRTQSIDFDLQKKAKKSSETVFTEEDFEAFARDYFVKK